jgi:hypothetical protein
MKSCIISCIPSLAFALFKLLCLVLLNQTFPVYLITDRKFYLFAKISLNQIRGFAKVFKSKFKANQKRREKEIRKRLKGPGGRIRPATEGSPRPTFPPSPNHYPSSLSVTDAGSHLSSFSSKPARARRTRA